MRTSKDSTTKSTFPDKRGRQWEMLTITGEHDNPHEICVRLKGHDKPNSTLQFFFYSGDKACDFVNALREAH